METPRQENELSYNFIIGFYNQLTQEPMSSEVGAMMCEAKKFFAKYLGDKFGDANLAVSVTNIEWTFNADCEVPINILFSIDATYGDGTSASSDDMYHALKLGDDEILDLIENYVWKSQPLDMNVFSNTNELTVEASTGAGITLPEGKTAEAICPEQDAPAPAPAGSSRNGM
jgi:hypothetical protein